MVEGNHGFTKEDLSCVSSDSPDDLKRGSENKEEIVVASVVTITPTDGLEFAIDVRTYSIYRNTIVFFYVKTESVQYVKRTADKHTTYILKRYLVKACSTA